jgi:hypothetical protein
MRKTLTTILALGLITGALLAPTAADARKRKPYKRVATYDYTVPAFGSPETVNFCPGAPAPAELDGCATFPTTAKDRFVVVKAEDASGTPVLLSISHPDSNGDQFVESLGYACGQSEKIAIQSGQDVIVFPSQLPTAGALESLGGPPQCAGVATQGTITATFTSK